MFSATDVANDALDAIGVEYTLGDIEEGNRYAQVCLRRYRPCLGALLKASHWSFARKQQPMQVLADTTGQLTTERNVIPPWLYEYAIPNDCVHCRYVPWQQSPLNSAPPAGNITPPNAGLPIMTGLAIQPALGYTRPARFLISRDSNFPPEVGQDYEAVAGVSPMGRTVVLTNVPQASLVYTSLVLTPSEWDPLFREAFVAYLASEIALALVADKKVALTIRAQQVAIAKEKISEARAMSANENWNVNSSIPDWIRARNVGRGVGSGWDEYGLEAGGIGSYGSGWGSIALGGAAF